MADLSEGMWNLVLQPQETYLHYQNATKRGSVVTYSVGGAPTYKITRPFD